MANHSSVTATFTSKLGSFICLRVYRSSVGKISKKVDEAKERLISNRDFALKKVEEIGERREVSKWLNDVEIAIDEVEKLEKKIETGCSGHSNNRLVDHETYWLYDEMIDKMCVLNSRYEYPINTLHLCPFPPLEKFTSGYFVSFKSTQEASDQLLKALEDDSIYIIGLYGNPGSGRTTLAKAVARISNRLHAFDQSHQTAYATVSKNINIWKIQAEIGVALKLKFEHNTKDGRARSICSAIKSSARTLVILDDIWEKFELKDIGIPFHGNCKVLLIARSQRECTLMECQREIPLHPLSKEEAWILFKTHSGLSEKSPSDLLNLAQECAFECNGVHALLKFMGSSLRNEPIEMWKASLDKLKRIKAEKHIFLSFKGGDTGFSFTSFLYHDLRKGGHRTFKDAGEKNSASLIEESWLSIIVLSENYAYSTRCLDELVKILECMKMKNQLVWPIFYKVEPSDIRNQRNSFGTAMAEHERRFGNDSEKIKIWRSALFEVSNLSGKAYKFGYEYEFIQKIVKDVKSYKK